MTQHSHQALPSLQFFVAEGTRKVGDHQQLMRQAALAEYAAADAPPSGSGGEGTLNRLLGFAGQVVLQTQ